MASSRIHIFIVSYPVQGQINPLLRLGKRLASKGGFLVTLATTTYFGRHIINATGITPGHLTPVGPGFLRFDFFEDDWTDTDPRRFISNSFFPQLELAGRKHVPEMLRRLSDEGHPVCCLINGTLIPWVGDVASELGIAHATMWAQSCASFLTFYSFYHKLVPFPTEEDPYTDVEIPTLPLLKWDELHSYLHPLYPRPQRKEEWLGEFGNLNKPFCILIDTFDDLEHDTIEYTSKLCPTIKPVGPLFKDPLAADIDLRGDRLKADFDCLHWLDSKPERSVVYVSFGPMVNLKPEQIDEIAHGILNTGFLFLWVMKSHTLSNGFLENGRLVEYSPQERVLAHPSVGCFVTHCGWNSTVESLTSGVPMVTFPQWGDQLTNTKFVVDVLGVGLRMGRGEHEDKVVKREDVEKFIREATVGLKAEELKRNALAWKDKAEKKAYQGGSSDKNLQDFVDEIRRRSGNAVDNYKKFVATAGEEGGSGGG